MLKESSNKKRTRKERSLGRHSNRNVSKTYFDLQEWRNWILRVRNFYATNTVSTNIFDKVEHDSLLIQRKQDNRPYIRVLIFNEEMVALVDSGASHSVIGKKGLYLIDRFNLHIFSFCDMNISTADGKNQQVLGYVNLPIQLDGVLKILQVLVVPSLCHNLILGSDFCQLFRLNINFANNSYFFIGNEVNLTSINALNCIKPRDELTEEQSIILTKIIEQFQELSWEDGARLGRTNKIVHRINTGNSEPVKQRQHVMSPYMMEHLYEELDRMLEMGVVQPSHSPWSSPILLVKKPGGAYRLCFDGRKLNSLTKKDAYPLPIVENILNKLTGAQYLTSIDLKSAFWQIPLDKSSQEKCAFMVSGRGLFEFTVMPFGLSNAAQTQQRLMDQVLGPSLDPYVFVYLDDIIIATSTFDKHVEILSEVYRRLKDANLTVNLEKCKFCRPSLKYLGYLVDKNGLRTDPDKVAAMLNLPRPENVTELKRFIGTVGWYRRFLKDFSTMTAPLTQLLKKKKKLQKLVWTEEAEKSFQNIKEALISAPILASPNYAKMFYIQCDASHVGLGAVLTQKDDDGNDVVCAFASRTLNDAERKYTVTELELAAVLFGIDKFRPYVEGVKFKVITDHHSLLWLNNLKAPTGRLARWAVKLSQYDIEFEFRKGTHNILPDTLSRAPIQIALLDEDVGDFKKDKWYEKMCNNVRDDPEKYSDWMISEQGILYKHVISVSIMDASTPQWKIVVPKHRRRQVIEECHDYPVAAHLGIFKTLARVRDLYYWPKLKGDVVKYVKSCRICSAQKSRNNSRPGLMGQPKRVCFPWQLISVDIVGPLPRSSAGNCYILVVSDYFSKYVLLHPMRQAKATTIIKFLENEVFLVYGTPQVLTVDNGTQFTGKLFKDFTKEYGVKIWYNARYHPQVNQVERVNRVVETAIRSYIKDKKHKHWDQEISKIAYALRTAVHEVTGVSPTYINFGRFVPNKGTFYGNIEDVKDINLQPFERDKYIANMQDLPKIYADIQEKLRQAYQRNQHTYNLRKRPSEQYRVGDKLWKKNFVLSKAVDDFSAKLAPKYVLCKVSQVISPLVYRLVDENGVDLGCFHQKDLKPFSELEEE